MRPILRSAAKARSEKEEAMVVAIEVWRNVRRSMGRILLLRARKETFLCRKNRRAAFRNAALPCKCDQKKKRKPNCMRRGACALVRCKKSELPSAELMEPVPFPNCVWLKMLKFSHRKSNPVFSLIGNRLK